jgi:autotransporter translocation and assembly factor TamB
MTMWRRVLQIIGVVLVVVTLVVLAGVALVETGWFKHKLGGWAMSAANGKLNGQLTIGGLSGNLFEGIELHDVAFVMDGQPAFTIPLITVKYRMSALISAGHLIDEIDVSRPDIFLRQTEHGWNLAHLTRPSPPRSGGGPTLGFRRIVLTGGTLHIQPASSPPPTAAVQWPTRLTALNGEIGLGVRPGRLDFAIDRMSFEASRPDAPAVAVPSLTGGFAIAQDVLTFSSLRLQSGAGTFQINGDVPKAGHAAAFNLHVSTDAVALPVLAPFVRSAARIPLHPAITLAATGPMDRLGLAVQFRSDAGQIAAQLTMSGAAGGRRLGGRVQLTHLNLAPFLNKPAVASDITADVDAQTMIGSGAFALSYSFTAPRAMVAGYQASGITAHGSVDRAGVQLDASGRAYGGRVTSVGRLTFPTGRGHRVGFNLTGRTADVDLSTLPRHLGMSKLPTRLNFGYTLTGEWPALQGHFALNASTAIGAQIAAGDTGSFSLTGPELHYAAAGTVSHLDLQRIGHSFDIKTLADDRYRTDLSGEFTLQVSGTRLATLALDATTHLTSSSAFDGRVVRADATAHLMDRRLTVKATGLFDAIDLERAFAIPQIQGRAGGTVDGTVIFADLDEPTSVDNVEWNGAIDLTDSVLEGLPVNRASFDGSYARRQANIRTLDISAPLIQGQAHGTFDLSSAGASQLTYRIVQLDLAAFGARIRQPFGGLAAAEGTLTGNAHLLMTSGHLSGSAASFGGMQVLDLESDYRASMPDLDWHRLSGDTTTDVETWTVDAHTIAESASLHAGYASDMTTFQGSAQNPHSTVSTAGTWHLAAGDRTVQTIDLSELTVATPGLVWQLPPGQATHVEYTPGRLAISGLQLVHDGETIAVSGTVGNGGTPLRMTVHDFDLATLDRILPDAPPLAGTIRSADATLIGSLGRPVVNATLSLTGGAYRSITDVSLGGTIRYAAGMIGLDLRVEQPASGTLQVGGRVPLAAFTSARATSNAPLDLTIRGQQMSLGLVTGLTGAVTDVAGRFTADVRLTGTLATPSAGGTVDVTDGTFIVAATGVRYSRLSARVALAGDRARIEQLSMKDPAGHTLQASGALALESGKLGVVEASVQADNFSVIDNGLASVDIDARLQVLGRLLQPRMTGTVTLRSARLDADRLLALVSRGATQAAPLIPTSATEATSIPAVIMGPPEPGAPPIAGVSADITVNVPDDLVITGSELTGSSAMGIGALNLTLGGTVRVQKAPDGPVIIAGTMNTARGSYAFQGRRFTIQQGGQIQFRGQSPIDPTLNIGATLNIAGVQTRVNVEGSMRTPRLALSSSPPLDEADILSLIVFNQPINQLGEQQQASLVSRASLLAAGALASSVAQSIGRALNLDIFEIEPSPATGATAAVTVGQQIGARLFVKVSQSIGRESATQFTIDYFLTSFMRLQSEITQGALNTQTLLARTDRSSVELVFFFSY